MTCVGLNFIPNENVVLQGNGDDCPVTSRSCTTTKSITREARCFLLLISTFRMLVHASPVTLMSFFGVKTYLFGNIAVVQTRDGEIGLISSYLFPARRRRGSTVRSGGKGTKERLRQSCPTPGESRPKNFDGEAKRTSKKTSAETYWTMSAGSTSIVGRPGLWRRRGMCLKEFTRV